MYVSTILCRVSTSLTDSFVAKRSGKTAFRKRHCAAVVLVKVAANKVKVRFREPSALLSILNVLLLTARGCLLLAEGFHDLLALPRSHVPQR